MDLIQRWFQQWSLTNINLNYGTTQDVSFAQQLEFNAKYYRKPDTLNMRTSRNAQQKLLLGIK